MININEDIKADEQRENAQAEDIQDEAVESEETETDKSQDGSTDDEVKEKSEDDAKASDNESKEEPKEDENTRYMRLMADFQNFKKRAAKEKTDLYQYANEKIVTELLTVLDNFERALEQEAGDAGFKEGMELIFKQLGDVLEKSGLAEIEALGEEFDPNFHNAVMTEESEEYESGKISGVLQKGYTLNGKVIRPSMVKVVG